MWQIRGQQHLVRALENSLRLEHLSHAYVLVGPPHVGKTTLALDIARAVNCLDPEERPCSQCLQCSRISASQHADVRVIGLQREEESSSRKEIGIDTIREIHHQASLNPYEGHYRVFIFDGAEYLSEEAANALLKTLEEPPPQILIMLLTSQEESLLPTIRSRCQRLELRPLPKEQMILELIDNHNVSEEQAEEIARLSRGCLGWALSVQSDPDLVETRRQRLERISSLIDANLEERFHYASELAFIYFRDRDEAREILYLWLSWGRDLLLLAQGATEYVYNVAWLEALEKQAGMLTEHHQIEFIEKIQQTLDALEQNANPRLALEVLMLSLPRTGHLVAKGIKPTSA